MRINKRLNTKCIVEKVTCVSKKTCKEYTTFVSLIKDGTINISNITSFAGVLKLYSDSESIIKRKIDYDNHRRNENKHRYVCGF